MRVKLELVVAYDRRSIRDIQVRVLRGDVRIHLVFQRAVEGFAQLAHEKQRAAEKHDGAFDRPTACQSGDGLGGDGLEDGRGEVRLGRAIVDERLEVGLGEHTATGGDRIQGRVLLRHVVEALGVRAQSKSA